MTTDTTVQVLPLYQAVEPYLQAFVTVVVLPLLGMWLAYILERYLGVKMTDSARAELQTTAANAAGRIFAKLEPEAATMSIDVRSPLIAAEVPKVVAKAGESLTRLGITPEDTAHRVADLVAGKLGQLQAAAASSVAPASLMATPGSSELERR